MRRISCAIIIAVLLTCSIAQAESNNATLWHGRIEGISDGYITLADASSIDEYVFPDSEEEKADEGEGAEGDRMFGNERLNLPYDFRNFLSDFNKSESENETGVKLRLALDDDTLIWIYDGSSYSEGTSDDLKVGGIVTVEVKTGEARATRIVIDKSEVDIPVDEGTEQSQIDQLYKSGL